MDQENTLAAAPAAWALVAVALNTISLQTGDVLGVPRKWACVYRISPIFCVIAALDSVIRLTKYTIDNRSLAKGSKQWITHRFGGIDPRSRQTLTGWTLVQVAFVIGVLSQAIKIYTTTNIICIQLYCTAYLADYLIEYVTTTFAAEGSNAVEPDLQRSLRAVQQGSSSQLDGFPMFAVSATLGYIPVTWALWLAVPDERFPDSQLWFGLAIFIMPVMLILYILYSASEGFQLTWHALVVLLCAFLDLVLLCMSFLLAIPAGDQVLIGQLAPVILPLLLPSIMLPTTYRLVNIDQRDAQAPMLSGNWRSVIEYVMACNALVLHALGGYIYFSTVYNVEATARPAWTNHLP